MTVVLADRYELRAPLGSGGMATVYEGYDRKLHRRVAVKVVRDELSAGPVERERLIREARSAASFNHPHAVAVYDTGEHDDQPYIVMELIEGRSLDEVLTDGPLDADRTVEIADGFLDALAAAHGAGLVHRDIKPGNILLPEDGGVKLADFGIAKGLQDASATLTGTGQIIGTPKYLSPEQVGGHRADTRSDVYAAGVVVYEMLAGRPPFQARTPMATALAHQREPPPPLDEVRPDLDPSLVAVVHRALEKDPDRRFADAAAMRAALLGLPADDAAHAPTVPIAARPMAAAGASAAAPTAVLPAVDRSGGGPPRGWPLLLVGVFALAALLAYAATRGDSPTAAPTEAPGTEATQPTAEPEGAVEPEPEPDPEPEPTTLAELIGVLAADPAAQGEKGEDLVDLLIEVSRMEPDKQRKEAGEAIKKIEDWVDDDELDPEAGQLAIDVLEPIAEQEDTSRSRPKGKGKR